MAIPKLMLVDEASLGLAPLLVEEIFSILKDINQEDKMAILLVEQNVRAALEIADKLQIPPAEFLYLGDTNTDMQTASAAGMYAVGATWGFRPAQELLDSGAKTLIDHPGELLSLL